MTFPEVVEEYKKVLEALAVRSPVLYLFAKGLRVVYYPSNLEAIAATDGCTVYLYKKWMELDEFDKTLAFIHELYHNFALHPFRVSKLVQEWKSKIPFSDENKLRLAANIACDAKVNYWIKKYFLKDRSSDIINIYGYIYEEPELEKEDVETLFEKLLQSRYSVSVTPDILSSGSSDSGIVLNSGKLKKEQEQEVEQLIAESILIAKSAGCKLSQVEEEMFSKLFQREIDWKSVIKQDLLSHLRKNVVSTWTKPNRKSELLQGCRSISKPKIWAFVDVSGSVWNSDVKQFLSEIANIARDFNVTMVTWDTQVTGEYTIKSLKSAENIKIRGSGGTTFCPIISAYLNKIKREDYVIVLTDAQWADCDDAKNVLKKLRSRKVLVRSTNSSDLDDAFNKVIHSSR